VDVGHRRLAGIGGLVAAVAVFALMLRSVDGPVCRGLASVTER
jgi:hypothetical protein